MTDDEKAIADFLEAMKSGRKAQLGLKHGKATFTPASAPRDEYRRGVEDGFRQGVQKAANRVEVYARNVDRTMLVHRVLSLLSPPADAPRDDACKTRTVHGCWCDLPNGHDGPHRSYDDPEPPADAHAGTPTGFCSAHRYGEDPKCRICYPRADAHAGTTKEEP